MSDFSFLSALASGNLPVDEKQAEAGYHSIYEIPHTQGGPYAHCNTGEIWEAREMSWDRQKSIYVDMLMKTKIFRARIQSQVPNYRNCLRISLDIEFKTVRLDEISHEVNLSSKYLETEQIERLGR